MIPFTIRLLSGQPLVYFGLFVSSALAALQNVTVDDAALIGSVVPQYLPSTSDWNVVADNNCTTCFVQPDPTLVYDGTWHDTTYHTTNSYTQAIEFTFTGSALYIFFILANNVTGATTLTDVQFVLDNAIAARYTHTPETTTDYQYNVAVYANESLGDGQHNMMIQPVNSGNSVLILFDYLIYTTDTSSSVSPSASTSPSPSATSSGTQGTSSGQNTGAIVGGAVGGVAALVLVIASLLCYRRYKRPNDGRPVTGEGAVMEPFYPQASVEVATPSLVGATSSIHPKRLPFAEPTSSSGASMVALQPSILPAFTTAPSSSGAQSSTNPDVLEQVEQLRDEVARLRDLHEAPPEYSTSHADFSHLGDSA